MRQVLLGLIGAIAANVAHAETYIFSAVTEDNVYQTLIDCTGPKTNHGGRVPEGCILSERATAYPNHVWDGHEHNGFVCAAGHPIVFHPKGTLAACTLDAEQPKAMFGFSTPVSLGTCKGLVRFDKDGRADC